MNRRLRYSERKRLAETGSLGELSRDSVPDALRNAVWLFLESRRNQVATDVRYAYDTEVRDELGRQFGFTDIRPAIYEQDIEGFLDVIEIVAEEAVRRHNYVSGAGVVSGALAANAEDQLNDLFDRHRFGFRLEHGEVREIGSPALSEEIVGPALLALARPGWENAERSYREALRHQRREHEARDALTSAAAAVEAAMKAAGFRGATLGVLVRSYRRSPLTAGFSPDIAEHLAELLVQLMAWRSHAGDAHGQAPGALDPPPGLVALAIHWAGAFIVYLADATAP